MIEMSKCYIDNDGCSENCHNICLKGCNKKENDCPYKDIVINKYITKGGKQNGLYRAN